MFLISSCWLRPSGLRPTPHLLPNEPTASSGTPTHPLCTIVPRHDAEYTSLSSDFSTPLSAPAGLGGSSGRLGGGMQRGKSDHYVRDEKFTMFASSMGQGAAVHAGPQGVLMEGGDRAGGRQGQFLCSFFSTKEIHVAPATDLFRAGNADRKVISNIFIFPTATRNTQIRDSPPCGGKRVVSVGGQ